MEGSELAFNLVGGLHPGQALVAEMCQDAAEIIAPGMCLAMALGTLQGMLQGKSFEAMMEHAGRGVCCLGLYSSYDAWFMRLVEAADQTATALRERSAYLESAARIVNNLTTFIESSDSTWDLMTGMLKGNVLSWSNLLSDWGVMTVLQLIVVLTLVFLNILYVIGPLMILGGVFADGMSLRAWGSSLARVLFWPVFPCFVLVVNDAINTDYEFARDNLSVGIGSNVTLALMFLFTPVAVNFLFSRAGLATMGALGWGASVGLAAKAAAAVATGGVSLLGSHFMPQGKTGSDAPQASPSSGHKLAGSFPRNEQPSLFLPAGGPRHAGLLPPSPYLGPDDGNGPAWARAAPPGGGPPNSPRGLPEGGPRAALPSPSPFVGPDGNGKPAWVRAPHAAPQTHARPRVVHPRHDLPKPHVMNAAGTRIFVAGVSPAPARSPQN